MRTDPGRTFLFAVNACLILLLGLTACGTERPAAVTPKIEGLDVHHPEDVAFYTRFRATDLAYNRIVRPPADLAAGVKAATAVVIAEVTDILLIDHPTVIEGGGGDVRLLVSVVLRPIEVLKGRLRPEPKNVVVELGSGGVGGGPELKAELRRTLPRGKAIWFLRWGGDPPYAVPPGEEEKRRYHLLHREGGIFVQGANGVVAPTAWPKPDELMGPTLRTDGEKSRRLGELAHRIRTGT